MPERANRIPPSKSWADEIDDLNREAMMRYLETIYSTRRPFIKIEAADDPLSCGKSGQRGASAGGVPR